jgi:hypothetical protein
MLIFSSLTCQKHCTAQKDDNPKNCQLRAVGYSPDDLGCGVFAIAANWIA